MLPRLSVIVEWIGMVLSGSFDTTAEESLPRSYLPSCDATCQATNATMPSWLWALWGCTDTKFFFTLIYPSSGVFLHKEL